MQAQFYILVISAVVALGACCNDGTKVPYPGTCHSYLECANGTYVKKTCPFFKHYWDVKSQKCVYLEATCGNVYCVEEVIEEIPDADGSHYIQCISGNRKVIKCPDNARLNPQAGKCVVGFVCLEGRRKFIDCKNYKECVKNTWVQKKCGWGRKFSDVEKKCVWWGSHCLAV